VLERLQVFGLYCKAEKGQSGVSKVAFLGFVISTDGIGMQSDRTATIKDRLKPKSIQDLQMLFSFTNSGGG
jgi:hypothetical protein